MNLRILVAIFLLGCGQLSFGQQVLDALPSSSVSSDTGSWSPSSDGVKFHGFMPKKLSSGVQLGSFFTSYSGYGSSFSTYVSPHISYALNSRFRINAGITIMNSNLNGIKPWYSMNQESTLSGNFTNALIVVSGDYLVNDRLKVSGTLFKEFNILNSTNGNNPYGLDNAQGAYMKVDYEVFKNFHIEAGFGYSKGVNPYQNYFGYPCLDPFIH